MMTQKKKGTAVGSEEGYCRKCGYAAEKPNAPRRKCIIKKKKYRTILLIRTVEVKSKNRY